MKPLPAPHPLYAFLNQNASLMLKNLTLTCSTNNFFNNKTNKSMFNVINV